jgi:hypothetical protein
MKPLVFQQSENLQVQIYKKEFKGKELLDIRQFFKPEDAWIPTKKGASLPMSSVPDLIEYLQTLIGTGTVNKSTNKSSWVVALVKEENLKYDPKTKGTSSLKTLTKWVLPLSSLDKKDKSYQKIKTCFNDKGDNYCLVVVEGSIKPIDDKTCKVLFTSINTSLSVGVE